MTVNWYNPYASVAGNWYKGNLHAHCLPESPCASITQEVLLDSYIDKDYDFLSISDHLAVTFPEERRLTLLPGTEWNSRAGYMPNTTQTQHDHIGIYASEVCKVQSALQRRTLPELLNEDGVNTLKIANHPDWLADEHFDINTLMRFANRIDGIEIYNFSIEADEGQADTTWKWDRLLSMGYPLLGFAHDDSHIVEDIGNAWLMVRAESQNIHDIYKSLKTGNFYCSAGVLFKNIGRLNSTISLTLENDAMIRVIGSYGRILATHFGTSMEWSFDESDTPYARFDVRNTSWQLAWSQPFFNTEI